MDNQTVVVSFDSAGKMTVCVENGRHVGSYGVWNGDNPLEFMVPITLLQVTLALVASHVLYSVLRPIRTPKFVCSVLGGILLGPSVLGHSKRLCGNLYPPQQAQFLMMAALMGASYFVFIVALKMDVVMTLRGAKKNWRLGLIPICSSLWVTLGLFYLLPMNNTAIESKINRVRFSFVLSLNNFPVICQSLMDLNLITSELGQIALSSSILNDICYWTLVGINAFLKNKEASDAIMFLFSYCLFVLGSIFVIRPVLLMIARKTPTGKPVKEVYILLILLGVLVMAVVGDALGLPLLQGPLMLGLVMPNGPPLGTTVIERSEVIVSHFLMPLFFVYVGLDVDVHQSHNWATHIRFQVIIVGGIVAKLIVCMLLTSFTYKRSLQQGLVLGLILNVKGIIELIIFVRMKQSKVLDDQLFSQAVISVMATTTILSPLIEILYKPQTRLERYNQHYPQMIMIQSTPRNSEFCIIPCVHNEVNVRSIIAFLEACCPTQESPMFLYVIHLIELLGKSTPFLLPVNKVGKKSLLVNYPKTNHIVRAFDNYSNNTNGVVNVQTYINVAPYKNMHESICNLAQDKLVPFLILPFHENDHDNHLSTSIRDLNANFQAYAPCTVGILVDRYSQLGQNTSNSPFHVGIFFIGGADDREALALGMRMCESENLDITLLRFVLQNKKLEANKDQTQPNSMVEEEEKLEGEDNMLDKCLIDEFIGRTFGKDNVFSREVVVEDGVQVLDAIRRLNDNYDLLMVGRKQNLGFPCDEAMSDFIETEETLGMVGDMLASTEFCNGTVPVLVTSQKGGKQRVNRAHSLRSVVSSFKSLGSKIMSH